MVAKNNYDSEFCGSLPLHNVNLIQDYGYLLVIARSGLKIIQASENCSKIFNSDVKDLIGTEFLSHLSNDASENVSAKFAAEIEEKVPVTIHIRGKEFLSLIHLKKDFILLELEDLRDSHKAYFLDKYQEIKYAMASINNAKTLNEAFDIALRELKAFSGFDRMLMYQFDEEWNGSVVAETSAEGLDPYLGLKFPASDIPKQARDLYLKNPYRLIPDRDFTPVKLYPIINSITQSFTDLSECNLRSVPAVHVEYLKNMKVAASMSTRIIKDGQLWGLISCHHRTPKYLNYEECSVFELISSVVSSKITSMINKEVFDKAAKMQTDYSKLVENIYAANDVVAGLINHEITYKDLINAGGLAISFKGKKTFVGDVPPEDDVDELLMWLQGKNVDQTYHLNHLSSVYDGGSEFSALASGMLAFPINVEEGEYVIAFRPEKTRKITWGGNPNDRIQFEPDGKKYHPRNSFKLWTEEVKETSEPWHESEIAVAENLREFISDYLHK